MNRILIVLLLLLAASQAGAVGGVRNFALIDENPGYWYQDSLPWLVGLPSTQVEVWSSLRGNGISYRLMYKGYPVSRSRTWLLSGVRSRLIGWSTWKEWTAANARNGIRNSETRGNLVPTIYLPLNMPGAIGDAIGTGGQLDISGHQTISFSGVSHIYPNRVNVEGGSTSLFPDLKMEQDLRIRLDGTIGEKIHVAVDHDSQRQIGSDYSVSLSYDGDDEEIIQSIELGDVNLSITGPEFISYSIPHQGLFGAKLIAQAGPFDITAIASKEGSSTESSDFVGQASLVNDSILDIRPANNYFFRVFPDTAYAPQINPDSIRVFIDDGDATNNVETGAIQGSWFIPDPDGGDETGDDGWWVELLGGIEGDFVLVDSSRTIRFLNPVNDNYRIAVALVVDGVEIGSAPDDGPYNLKLIKESNPFPSDLTWPYEMRNYYFLGANNIVRESFNCDIFLQRPGEDPTSIQDGIPFTQVLGLDTNGDGIMYDEDVTMDWDNGFIIFPESRPFASTELDYPNSIVYTEKNPTTNQSLYYMRVSYRAASTTYSLGHMGIVEGSEKVTLTVAGQAKTLVRNTDYSIIYEVGLLTLMGEAADLAQDPANTLRVTFEYVPFFSSVSKTLLGTRVVFNMGTHSWFGGTMMYESASSPETRPRIGEGSFGTTVFDADLHLETRPEFLTDAVNLLPLVYTEAESRVILSGEVAVSLPSGESRAWLDDMEGSESTFPIGQSRAAWFCSSMPKTGSPLIFPVGESRWYNATDRWTLNDIIPGETGNDAFKKISGVLQFVFSPDENNPTDSWGGFQRCIERYGTDFSDKTHLSLYVRATGCAFDANLYIDLGERIDEDTYWLERVGDDLIRQANGLLDTEDVNSDGIRSSTEDTGFDILPSIDEPGYSSSNLDPNQDNYRYDTNDPLSTRFNAINNYENNGRLDTEDLNRNGDLDSTNVFFRIRIPLNDPDYIVSTSSSGWMLVQIPLDDSLLVTVPEISEGDPTWEKIIYARIWVDGFAEQDTLEFYDMGLVGNRWKPNKITLSEQTGVHIPVQPEEMFTVSVVNNRQNQDYISDPPPNIDPGEGDDGEPKLEQSINLVSSGLLRGHQGVARQTFYAVENYTQYRSLSFPYRGSSAGGELFFQMGRDSLNYYEVSAEIQPGWQLVEIDLQDLVDLKTLLEQTEENEIRSGNLAVVGNPSLSEIMMLGLGVRNNAQSSLSNQVWVDDITVKGHYLEPGNAHRVSGEVDFADLLSVSGDYRMIDDDFHGLGRTSGTGTTVTRYSSSTTLNLDRFSPPVWNWSLPATYAWSRNFSEPRYAKNSDIRLEGDETWLYRTESNRWDTSIQWRRNGRSDGIWGRYLLDPIHIRHALGNGWGRTPSTRDSVQAESVTFSYDLQLGRMSLFRMPILEDIRLRPTRLGFSLGWRRGRNVMYDIANSDTVLTRDDTERVLLSDGNIAFNPWKGLTASYSLAVGRDMYYPWDEPYSGINIGREVSRSQNAGISQEINFWDYLKPRVSWDVRYGMTRLSPHTATGADTLSLPDVGSDVTARLNLRVGLAHTIRSIARLRDERLDEEALPGSPRWLLSKMERWADRITDPNIVFSRSRGSDYNDVPFIPSTSYQFGLEPDIAGLDPYNKTTANSMQISGGYRPTNTMSVRIEYNDSENRSFYSGYWNRTDNTTWPAVTVSWSGLERYRPLAFLRNGSVSSGYRLESSTSSRIETDSLIPVSKTETSRWSPLLSFTGSFDNKVQITLSDNMSNTETRNYTGTSAVVRSGSNSAQFKLTYSFSAPGGLAIPLPLLNQLRLSFQSDLTTSLSITRSNTRSEVTGGQTGETQVQSDKTEWRIEPSASYDFGTVTASMTAIYGWKKDKVNNQYDQKDIGLNLSVTINF